MTYLITKHLMEIRNNPPGVSESDPNMWIDGLHILFKRLSKRTDIISSIKCLSVSGQQHGLVALDLSLIHI